MQGAQAGQSADKLPSQNKNQLKQTNGFANPICKETYRKLPLIYGKKKKSGTSKLELITEKKNSSLVQSKHYFSSPQQNNGKATSMSKKPINQKHRLSEPKHPSQCTKKNCSCHEEEEALRKLKEKKKRTLSTTLMGRIGFPEVQKFQLQDLESKHKISMQGLTTSSNFNFKSGLQTIIQQQNQRTINLRKSPPQKEKVQKQTLPNYSSAYLMHKTSLKLHKNTQKFKIKINKAKFDMLQQEDGSNESEQNQAHQASNRQVTRYKTEGVQSPKHSKSDLINKPVFRVPTLSKTNFNITQKSPFNKISRNPSQLSSGLFRIPDASEYKDYLRSYINMSEQFDLKALVSSPKFKIQKNEHSVYFGQLDQEENRHGHGIQVSAKEIFEGQFVNDLKFKGFERNIDGVYIGGYQNGERSGLGAFHWNNGEKFEGNWKNGLKNGLGTWLSPKGYKYEGQWLHNRQHGKGVFEHRTSTYKGQFKNFLKDGIGQELFSNGDIYKGEYRQGKPNGKGRYQWKKGGFYEGEFKQGMREGPGIWIDENNTKYEVQVRLKQISNMDLEQKLLLQDNATKESLHKGLGQRGKYFPKMGHAFRQNKSDFRALTSSDLQNISINKNWNSSKLQQQKTMKKMTTIGEYQIIRKIGSGLTAQVYEAKNKKNERVSIKCIDSSFRNSKIGGQLITNQIKILSQLRHKNILKFIQKIDSNNKTHIITDYCEGGDLQSYISRHKKLDEKEALNLMKGIVQGCLYLREKQIVHRDLKPSNIFLKQSQPILADFGFAVRAKDKALMSVNAGSPLYMPLESLTNKNFSEKSDVFALGVCLFEMLTGKTPWPAKSEKELISSIQTPPKNLDQFSNKTSQLLSKSVSCDPKLRPNMAQMLSMIQQILATNGLKRIDINIPKIQLKKQKSVSFNSTIKKTQEKKQNIDKSRQVKKLKSLTVREQPVAKKMVTDRDNQFLRKVNPDQFCFLPDSVIAKFKCILHKYKKIVQPTHNGQSPILPEKDSLIDQIQNCTTQLQLCRSIQSFIRRLFRLTKNYKQYKNCHSSLQKLYERVTSIIM